MSESKSNKNVRIWTSEKECLESLSEDLEWLCGCHVWRQIVPNVGARDWKRPPVDCRETDGWYFKPVRCRRPQPSSRPTDERKVNLLHLPVKCSPRWSCITHWWPMVTCRVYSRHVAGGGNSPRKFRIPPPPRKSARANFQSRIKMSKILAFHGCCCDWRSIIRS